LEEGRNRADIDALDAVKLHQAHPVVLTPVLTFGQPTAFNPLDGRFIDSKNDGVLRESITEIREPLSAIPFDLGDDRVDEIVRIVLR
jgi:hypothetical protein